MTAIVEKWDGARRAPADLGDQRRSQPSGYVWSERDVNPGGRLVNVGPEPALIASAQMEKLYARVQHAARVPVPVLLLGETGTGKEWLAHAVHVHSRRSAGPFRALNCGSIPPSLTEATLFGSERGAFTGAMKTTKGVFELASGGTVFLDELGELTLAAQAALLRVLDGQPFMRIGGTDEIRPDVRIVAATNRDLQVMVEQGKFRLDLYYRLSTVSLRVPPLRERREEIPALSRLFLQRASSGWGGGVTGLSPDTIRVLQAHSWPGNLRQLRNAIEASVVRAQGPVLTVADLPGELLDSDRDEAHEEAPIVADPSLGDYRSQVREFETRLILEALKRTGGNQRKAALLLKLPHRTLVHKIRAYEIKKVYRS